jgi:hypothetical protein
MRAVKRGGQAEERHNAGARVLYGRRRTLRWRRQRRSGGCVGGGVVLCREVADLGGLGGAAAKERIRQRRPREGAVVHSRDAASVAMF